MEGDGAAWVVIGYVAASLFWGPIALTHDDWSPYWYFADHPYADDQYGFPVWLTDQERWYDPTAPPVQMVSLQVRGEGGYVFGDVARGSLEARLMLPYRVELDVGGSFLAEAAGPRWLLAGMGTAHVGLRFAQTEQITFRAAVGARVYGNEEGVAGGFDFRYGIEIFPIYPVVISLEGTLGNVGEAFVGGGRGTVGFMLGPIELYVGYDHLTFEPLGGELRTVHFGGPIGGVRGWI